MTTTIKAAKSAVVVTPDLVVGYSSSRATRNVFHPVLVSATTSVTLNGTALRTGQLTLLFQTEAAKVAAMAQLVAIDTFHLSSTDLTGIDMDFAMSGTLTDLLDPDSLTIWTLTFDWTEVQL